MKKSLLLLVLLMVFIKGCGPIVGLTKGDPTIKVNGTTTEQELKIDKNKVRQIRKLTFLLLPSQTRDRVYMSGFNIITSEIEKSKRFKIISAFQFDKKMKAMGISLSPNMTQAEFYESIATVAKALNLDAIFYYSMKMGKTNMGSSTLQYGLTGTVDFPYSFSIDVRSSNTAETIYNIKQSAVINRGSKGFREMSNEEIKQLLFPAIKPLVDEFLKAFM